MGELSKLVGEIGEDIVGEFFDLIGWNNTLSAQSLNCQKQKKHAREGSKKQSRETHGIDYLHSYRSPLEYNAVNNLVISVKNSKNVYPSSPIAKFKEHIKDLAEAVECFNRSPLKVLQNEKFLNFSKTNDIGVLFWLSHHSDTDHDLTAKVENCQLDPKLCFSTIYLVDNLKIEFIFQVMNFLNSKLNEYEKFFYYPTTALNYGDGDSKHGKSLPVEFINSPIIPFLLKKDGGVDTLCLAVSTNFHEDEIAQLIQIAREYTNDLTCNYLLLFPDYVHAEHSDAITNAVHLFEGTLKNSVKAMNYQPDYRSLNNGER